MPRRTNSNSSIRSRSERYKRKMNLRLSSLIFKRRCRRIEEHANGYAPWLGYFADDKKTHIKKPHHRFQQARKKRTNKLVRKVNLSLKGTRYKKIRKYEYGKVW